MPIVLASASRKEKIFVETRCAEGRSIVHAVYFDERIIFSSKLIHILSCISSSLLSVSLSLSLLRLSTFSSFFTLSNLNTTRQLQQPLSLRYFIRAYVHSLTALFFHRSFTSIHIYLRLFCSNFCSSPILFLSRNKNRLTLKKNVPIKNPIP